MYKRTLLFISILLVSLGLNAQVKTSALDNPSQRRAQHLETKQRGSQLAIRYGLKAGLNLSTMSNGMEFNPGFGMGTGFRIGAVANFHWGQRTVNSLPGTGWFGLQPELMYSYQSVSSDGGNINMHYLQLPVMVRIYPLPTLGIEVGPEFNYLITTSPKKLNLNGASLKIGDCNGFNLGIGAGIVYEFRMGLIFGARYSFGFTDLGKNLKWKNNGNTQITVGWLF